MKRARDRGDAVPRLVYAAHVDEIGLMVTNIDADGFVRFRSIGGYDPRTLVSQRVVVHGTRNGPPALKGVIPTQAGWLGTEADRQRVFPIEELYIDLARPGPEVHERVHVGDVVTLDADFEFLNDEVVMGRNFDDRVGVYSLIEAMKRIETPPVDVFAVSSVQEEVGVRGMPVAATAIEADIGVAIDGSLPSDTPYAKSHQRQCLLGHGTGIYLIDKPHHWQPGADPSVDRRVRERGHPLSAQHRRRNGRVEIQRTGLGALSTTIGAPTRYMHSTVQLCHVKRHRGHHLSPGGIPPRGRQPPPPDWR